MERGEYEELKKRNNTLYLLIGIIFVATIIGIIYYGLQETPKEETQTPQTITEKENRPTLIEEEQPTNNTTINNNITTNNTNTTTKKEPYNFTITSLQELTNKTCYATPTQLFTWFGPPMHEAEWQTINGTKTNTGFKFFLWNDTVLYTKGRHNKEKNIIETYEYLARENINRSIQKIIECE